MVDVLEVISDLMMPPFSLVLCPAPSTQRDKGSGQMYTRPMSPIFLHTLCSSNCEGCNEILYRPGENPPFGAEIPDHYRIPQWLTTNGICLLQCFKATYWKFYLPAVLLKYGYWDIR